MKGASTFAFLASVAMASEARASGFPNETYKTLPCRPTIACTADLVPPGSVEVETGYLRRRTRTGLTHIVPLLLKLSISEDLQMQTGTNTAFLYGDGHAKGFDDLFGGIKWRIAQQQKWPPSLAVSLLADGIDIPASHATAHGALFTLYATKDFGWLHADLNVGVNRWWLGGATATQEFAALALSTDVGYGFGVMAEGYVFSDAAFVQPKDAGFLSTITYAPVPYLMFDIGSDVALFTSTRAFNLYGGLTLILVDLWDEVQGKPREHARARRAGRLRAL